MEEHRTSFITNLCMMCCRETTTANVLCGTHAEYTEVPVTCLRGHRTQQQLFSKCTCGFKSNGYIEPLALVAMPLLTPVPRNPCMICDRPIVHITYQKPTSSVFISDYTHNHINDTYTSVAVCVSGHHTSTTVAYHCTCGWPNAARLKKWQRIQELAAHHKDLKYIEDPILAIDNDVYDGFPDEHTINDKPLEQFEKHTLLAETMYAPAYACSICDANIRYVSIITHDSTRPYSDGSTTHQHDSSVCGIVTCKNYHVTRDKIIRYCSCGWPNKSSANNYTDTLAEMDKSPDPHQHTGNCRCLKIMPKRLPTNPLYKCSNIQKQDDEQLPQPVLLNIGDSHTGDTQRLTTMLMAKDPCSICNCLVSTVSEEHRTELCYEPFVEDGIEHNHNGNQIIGNGVCVKGHVLSNIVLYDVCECGWPTNNKKVTELQNKLTAKYPCSICNALVSNVKELFSTLLPYSPYVKDGIEHKHDGNITMGDGVCINGHLLNDIELYYKCERGWPEDTKQPDKPLDVVMLIHTHTFNTMTCCICAASTKAVDGPRNTSNDTSDTIYTLVKCTNGHQTSQRCTYTCGPPCYIDKLRKDAAMMKQKQLADETMLQFRPVTANNLTSQLTHSDCSLCSASIMSCSDVVQTNILYKPYIDTNGVIHNHDCNTVSGTFTCINGHTAKQETGAKCSCGWVRSVPFTTQLATLLPTITQPTHPVRSTARPLAPTQYTLPVRSTARPLAPTQHTLLDAIDAGLKL